ncbi:hypothetical protein [Actinoplanes sp. DH11]|uniref:hypothetical protein n=1 Tax=Actinoplanes sp. DH11 TaxID=2857011 RepID=UPI001E3B286D|nr:hypothetical protein [Actinoplanes sp. DH11]
MSTIGFLHTAEVHVATFQRLVEELAPGCDTRHLVDASLLADARASGVTSAIAERVRARLAELESDGAEVIVCTCSTIGAAAEEASEMTGRPGGASREPSGPSRASGGTGGASGGTGGASGGPGGAAVRVPVVRVDRPMADAAVTRGGRIAVVVAVASTTEPTMALLRESATAANAQVDLVAVPCLGAWRHFEAGEIERYHDEIAEHVRAVADGFDVVVLAQASMSPAAERLPGLPVLTSPRAAVAAAVTRLH